MSYRSNISYPATTAHPSARRCITSLFYSGRGRDREANSDYFAFFTPRQERPKLAFLDGATFPFMCAISQSERLGPAQLHQNSGVTAPCFARKKQVSGRSTHTVSKQQALPHIRLARLEA